MPFPNYPDKHNLPAVLTAQDLLAYRRQLGRFPNIQPPEGMILCLQKGLPERLRRRHRLKRIGSLMGDLYLLKKSRGKVGVLTNFGIGAPLIAALTEELVAWGVRRFISMSWAGGLQPDLEPGAIVACSRAIRDEGTSHHYLPANKYVRADPELVKNLTGALAIQGHKSTEGTTWTTDAPYRETRDEILQYQAEGVLVVEMETAALLAVGQARAVQTAAVCVVGDSLAEMRWEAPPDVRVVEQALECVYGVAISVLMRI
jgi:uridine phosphorylase